MEWWLREDGAGGTNLVCNGCAWGKSSPHRVIRFYRVNEGEHPICAQCGTDGSKPLTAPSVPSAYSRRGRPVEDTLWHTGWWKD